MKTEIHIGTRRGSAARPPGGPTSVDAAEPAGPSSVTEIGPPSAWPVPDLADVWRYRDMLLMLAARGVAARYRQSVLGVAWAVVRPLVSVAVLTLVFGRIAGLGGTTGGVPYALFVLAAMVPWSYFAACLSETTGSVVSNQDMLTKVYFPRLVLPLASVAAATIDFAVQSLVLAALMAVYRAVPPPAVVFLPLFLFLIVATAFAGGLWLTSLNVRYRDIGHALPFLVQILMYLCPVIYPASLIPDRWRTLYFLNPLAGGIEGVRWSLLGTAPPDPTLLALSAAASGVLLLSGLWFFARTEQTFADVI